MTDKLYFGATTACHLNQQPNTFMQTQYVKKLGAFLCLGLALFGLNLTASAQIRVGPTGSTNEAFDARPPAAMFSTKTLPGAAANPESDSGVDDYLNGTTNAASTVTAQVDSVAGDPPAAPASGNAMWTSSGYLVTRPTGNAVTLMMATLTNVTGGTINSFHVKYTYIQKVASVANEAVKGHRVYYNLTGAANNWVPLGDFGNSFTTNVAQDID